MVKLIIKDEKLYLEKAGKKTQINHATIEYYKSERVYKITTFKHIKNDNIRSKYIQKTYPIPGIKLRVSKSKEYCKKEQYNEFLDTKGKYFYINFYVYN